MKIKKSRMYISFVLLCALVIFTSVVVLGSCVNDDDETIIPTIKATRTSVDVEKTIRNLETKGVAFSSRPKLKDFVYSDFTFNKTHIQGLARYKDFSLFTINGDPDKKDSASSTYYLYIVNDTNRYPLKRILPPKVPDFPEDAIMTHTNSMQVTGDYLIVSVDDESGKYPGNWLWFYDLAPIPTGGDPVLRHMTHVDMQVSACGSVTIGDREALVLASPDGNLLVSDIPDDESDPSSLNFIKYQKSEDSDTGRYPQAMALLTDSQNRLWHLLLDYGGKGNGETPDYANYVVLYSFEFLEDTTYRYKEVVPSFEVLPFDSFLFALACHFRFAGTAQVQEDGSFWIFSTQSIPVSCLFGVHSRSYFPMCVYKEKTE
ncbi:MAG: hypothetical protein LBU04_00615 [Christensenellaceae bacterium]|jgi:hypothetical protein|nr:hypothetical protein [Christensenellaceae bacterium]